MAGFPPISVRQPRPHDIVDDPVSVCGIGTGFEGVISARVRDANGTELKEVPINAGGTGIWGNFQVKIDLPGTPSTARGTLAVFELAADGSGRELNKVVVPIIFGKALISPYHGFAQYTVESGDTLSSIAEQFYGDPEQWRRVFRANGNQIDDPEQIFPGQVLRIPQQAIETGVVWRHQLLAGLKLSGGGVPPEPRYPQLDPKNNLKGDGSGDPFSATLGQLQELEVALVQRLGASGPLTGLPARPFLGSGRPPGKLREITHLGDTLGTDRGYAPLVT